MTGEATRHSQAPLRTLEEALQNEVIPMPVGHLNTLAQVAQEAGGSIDAIVQEVPGGQRQDVMGYVRAGSVVDLYAYLGRNKNMTSDQRRQALNWLTDLVYHATEGQNSPYDRSSPEEIVRMIHETSGVEESHWRLALRRKMGLMAMFMLAKTQNIGLGIGSPLSETDQRRPLIEMQYSLRRGELYRDGSDSRSIGFMLMRFTDMLRQREYSRKPDAPRTQAYALRHEEAAGLAS